MHGSDEPSCLLYPITRTTREGHQPPPSFQIIFNIHFDRHLRFAPVLQSGWANGPTWVGISLCPLPYGGRKRLSGISQCVLVVTQADPSSSGSRCPDSTLVVFL